MSLLRGLLGGLCRRRDAERFALTTRGWACVRCERRWGR